MPKKADLPEFGTSFGCLTCDPSPEPMERAQFVEHLKAVHGLESPIKGSRQMDMHLDCTGYFMSTYNWTFGEVKAVQTTVGPRGKH